MKTIILAGGFGTRLSEYTGTIPKPMVEIGEHPILWHLMNIYAGYGYNQFYTAVGYKGQVIKDYFLNYYAKNSDFKVNLTTGIIENYNKNTVNWEVSVIDTGLDTMTGGRVKRLKNYIGKERFMLTYGDGLADINIAKLIEFHQNHGKMVTVTAVHPVARFGEIDIADNNQVKSFKEKPQTNRGWINGGFFVIEPEFFDLIEGDSTILEKEPLEKAAQLGQLIAYKHDGFWQCMDTLRDCNFLNELWQSGQAPWKRW